MRFNKDRFTIELANDRVFIYGKEDTDLIPGKEQPKIKVGLIKFRDGVLNCYPILDGEVEWGNPMCFLYPKNYDYFDYSNDITDEYINECENEIRKFYKDVEEYENSLYEEFGEIDED